MTDTLRKFTKPPLLIEDHIALLLERGLIISDQAIANRYIQFIGYYRLSAYMRPFQKYPIGQEEAPHDFLPDVTFEQVLDLYIFDRKLRLLVLDAIERIEVAIKAVISDVGSLRHGSHWFMNAACFDCSPSSRNPFDHNRFLADLQSDIERHQAEPFIKHYKENYDTPVFPPSWMVFQLYSFSTVSYIYKSLERSIRKDISQYFILDEKILGSWLHSISCTRNICAHHARLWNKTFTIKPTIPRQDSSAIPQNNRFFAQTFVIAKLLWVIAQDSSWQKRLEELLLEHPKVDISKMGFPQDWKTRLPH